jgi:hypothetical protein
MLTLQDMGGMALGIGCQSQSFILQSIERSETSVTSMASQISHRFQGLN